MASVSVFKEKKTKSYKHTFKNQMEHLEYLLTQYVNQEEKVKSRCFCGINCDDDPASAYQDFISTKMAFNKYEPDNDKSREFKHYSIGFEPTESKMLGVEKINKMCKEIIERVPEFKNFQVSIATHEDKKHIHSHIIINSVNMIDGHKIQLSKDFLTKFQHICNEYTNEHNLKIHTLPNAKKLGDDNKTHNRIDWNCHQKGNISKTEQFARRIEDIIKKTKNRYELFKAMKENNLKMSWRDDKQYNNKLNVGKISITDNETGECHRLESLYKTYNIDLMNNIDLVEHFKMIDKINELKNDIIIKGVKVNKNDLIKFNNEKELVNTYKEIKELIKSNNDLKYWQLEAGIKGKLREYTRNLYENTPSLKEIIKEKTEELLIKAKDLNKDLNFKEEEKAIEQKLINVMANKVFNEIKFNKEEIIAPSSVGFLLKAIGTCIKNANRSSLNKADELNKKGMLELEKKKARDIEKAITY